MEYIKDCDVSKGGQMVCLPMLLLDMLDIALVRATKLSFGGKPVYSRAHLRRHLAFVQLAIAMEDNLPVEERHNQLHLRPGWQQVWKQAIIVAVIQQNGYL